LELICQQEIQADGLIWINQIIYEWQHLVVSADKKRDPFGSLFILAIS
jgi:hypothetical protein